MPGLCYDKWDALGSDDDDDEKSAKSKTPTVVKKQAVRTSSAEELAAAKKEAEEAAVANASLQARAENLLLQIQSETTVAGADADTHVQAGVACLDPGLALPSGAEVPRLASGGVVPDTPPKQRRPRGLDCTWGAEAERDFQARTADSGRGQAIVAELTSAAENEGDTCCERGPQPWNTLPDVPTEVVPKSLAKAGGSSAPLGDPHELKSGSSLRKLKQLDLAVAGSIEQECGVNLGHSDVFRLTLENPASHLRRETRVLIACLGEHFLCEEEEEEEEERLRREQSAGGRREENKSGSEVRSGEAGPVASETTEREAREASDGARGPATVPEAEEGAVGRGGALLAETATGSSAGTVVVELRFFRATPQHSKLAKKLSKVPTLHVSVATDDGLCQSMEFLGVHQRQYCAEEPPCDAIAQNLIESLLKVVLEFIFHPSRSRYARERLVLRECSCSEEGRRSRESFLPQMAENLRGTNATIKEVIAELGGSGWPSREDAKKRRSFLVLDEEVLKMAPVKKSMTKPPSSKGAFKGLGQGFLNSSSAKKHGLSSKTSAFATSNPAAAAAASAAAEGPDRGETNPAGEDIKMPSVSDAVKPSERTRINNTTPELTIGPPPVETDREDRQKLVLPAAYVDSAMTAETKSFAENATELATAAADRKAAAGCSAAAEAEAEAETEEEGPPQSMSEIADQLFGAPAGLDEDISGAGDGSDEARARDRDGSVEDARSSESTRTPPPCADPGDSSQESPCEAGTNGSGSGNPTSGETATTGAAGAPAAGLRGLLRQRRETQERAEEAARETTRTRAVPDESDELVKLWMKQRW